MRDTTKKKRGAIIAAVVVIAVLSAYLGTVLFAMVAESLEELAVALIMIVYGGMILAVIFGVVTALNQRLKELDGGEEEDAKQY